METATEQRIVPGICFFLFMWTWVVFFPVLQCGFINFDDPGYVVWAPMISGGVTLDGIRWSLTHSHGGNWHPLTSLSHMLDCQLFGLNPPGHHFTNLMIHATTVILLFQLVRQMTGFLWRSAVLAALFAIHPLRVESVVWISERKDVLSGFFFMLTLLSYVSYVRRTTSVKRYFFMMLFSLCGLLSKPMLVTLPGVLFLLDYWPLKRSDALSRRIVEKIPLMVLSAVVSATTFWAQQNSLLKISVPFSGRISNALVAYGIYLKQMIFPFNLALVYPHPGSRPALQVTGAALLLIAITVVVWIKQRKQPWLLTGWLWYLGMLLPVIGLIQVGVQAHADRYTYLPCIGILLILTWGVAESSFRQIRLSIRTALVGLILIPLALATRAQVGHWRSSITVWSHTLECTGKNLTALTNLGVALFDEGEVDASITCFSRALQIDPNDEDVRRNLKIALLHKIRTQE